jgi:hypothetical protein
LEEATNDLVRELTRGNAHLRTVSRSTRRQRIDNARALSVVLAGRSPVTGEEERVTDFTRELPDDHVLYALFIAPGRDYNALSKTFQRMISSCAWMTGRRTTDRRGFGLERPLPDIDSGGRMA